MTDNQRQELESGSVAREVSSPAAKSSTQEKPNALERLLHKQVRKFSGLLPGVMGSDDPEVVHDVRVSTRRMQQCLATLLPKPRSNKVRRLRRTVRRVRGLLGEWRNCDVGLELITKERRRTRSPVKREAWEAVRGFLTQRRGRQVVGARRKLLKLDLAGFVANLCELLDQPAGQEDTEALGARLRASIESAQVQLDSTLSQARDSRDPIHIHALRISTKRLRYRMELAHHLGDDRARPVIDWLKGLQEALGKWHDRQVFRQIVAEALARPDFLLHEPCTARVLLVELEKDQVRQGQIVDNIFRLAIEDRVRYPVEDSVPQ